MILYYHVCAKKIFLMWHAQSIWSFFFLVWACHKSLRNSNFSSFHCHFGTAFTLCAIEKMKREQFCEIRRNVLKKIKNTELRHTRGSQNFAGWKQIRFYLKVVLITPVKAQRTSAARRTEKISNSHVTHSGNTKACILRRKSESANLRFKDRD